jgi:GxxExxY protein
MDHNTISASIVDAAMKVHSTLGPGLLESVYETCLVYELRKRGHDVQTQLPVPIIYDQIRIDGGLRLDLLVDALVIVELKAVAKVLDVHEAQLLTHLRLSGKRLGLLINFHECHLRNGIRRKVNHL